MPGKPGPVWWRFWSKVSVGDGCWEWQAQIGKHGYGCFDHRFENRAHRASWRLQKGDIPVDMQVLHRCDNKTCVRPSHLFLGTQKDNVVDCVEKGRINRGKDRPAAKLTEDDVRRIRELYVPGYGGFGYRRLAKMFGVWPGTIKAVIDRKGWRHIA